MHMGRAKAGEGVPIASDSDDARLRLTYETIEVNSKNKYSLRRGRGAASLGSGGWRALMHHS